MRIKCGTDIIEINRIKDSIESLGDKFINKVFTEKEIKYCEAKKKQQYQQLLFHVIEYYDYLVLLGIMML